MPHITVEVPASLAKKIDWRTCFLDIHKTLDAQNYGRLEDFKSRVLVSEEWLVADQNSSATFIFATLQTMNARPPEMLRAMGKIVHERLEQEAKAAAGSDWVLWTMRGHGRAASDSAGLVRQAAKSARTQRAMRCLAAHPGVGFKHAGR